MLQSIVNHSGVFFVPQMALSVLVVALVLSYGLAWLRGELRGRTDRPWVRTLDPLAGFAVSLGLLGSVWSFMLAFGGFSNGIDIDRVTSGLATAYTTTGVGLITSLIAGLGSYLLGLTVRGGAGT